MSTKLLLDNRPSNGYDVVISAAEVETLWNRGGISSVLAGIWSGTLARKTSTLIECLNARYPLDAVLAVEHVFQRQGLDDAAILLALSLGMDAAKAKEFDAASTQEGRTLVDVISFMHPELPRDYAESLV